MTTVLVSVDDYLSWRTLFTGFMIIHQLFGMLEGSNPQPTSHLLGSLGTPQPNPIYGYWLQVDQLIRA